MDILAARKKAAEQAKSRTAHTTGAQTAETAAPEAQRADEGMAQHETETVPAPVVHVAEPTGSSTTDTAAPEGVAADASDEQQAEIAEDLELLCFDAAGESYAVPVDDVREVLKFRSYTIVPNSPAHILGVMSLRGVMLPVVDLALRLGLSRTGEHEKSRIVVVAAGDEDVGLLVDRVTGVLSIAPEGIKPAPEHAAQGGEFLRGIVRQKDKLYILLDLPVVVNG